MHSGVPEKLLALAQEIAVRGNASLTRLTVLKQHFDTRHGDGLNGPSRAKIQEIVRFLVQFEASEDQR